MTDAMKVAESKRRPRPDLNAIYDRWEQFEAAGLEVQGSAQIHRDADGNVKIVFTVAERLKTRDS